MTDGDRNYLKQQKSVEFLLLWSQFSSSDFSAIPKKMWAFYCNHVHARSSLICTYMVRIDNVFQHMMDCGLGYKRNRYISSVVL